MLGASLGGKHAKNTSAAADIKNSLALEQMFVLDDGVAVAYGADLVLQHLLHVRVRRRGETFRSTGFLGQRSLGLYFKIALTAS